MLLDAGLRVIDLSADYRLTEPALYQKAYGHPHEDVKSVAMKGAIWAICLACLVVTMRHRDEGESTDRDQVPA
jgi:hypothetical protein